MAVLKLKLSLKGFLDHCCCIHVSLWGLAREAAERRLQPDLQFSSRGIPESKQVCGICS